MRVCLIVNPVSGAHNGRPALVRRQTDEAVSTLRDLGAEVELRFTESRGHATRIAAAAAAAGTDVVAAWGGDGTMNEVAAALAGSPSVLAVVPAGSGSGLARALGVPLNWRKAIALALGGDTRPIDVGAIDGRTFVNVAGLGLDAHIARVFNDDRQVRPGRRGLAAYVRITLREFFRYEPLRCRVAVGGDQIDGTVLMVALANSPQYGNGARIAPAARLDDGEVDVVVVRATSPVKDLLRARRLFDGSIARDAGAVLRRAPRVVIDAERALEFHTDGEPYQGGSRLEVEMRPRALLVRVSKQETGNRE